MIVNILLVGYYGHGNFGDDILFKVAYRFVLRSWPGADIVVQTEADQPGYLEELAGQPLRFLRSGETAAFDLILHGGGGNFFDFSAGSWVDRSLNQFARSVGYRRFGRARARTRQWLKRASLTGSLRFGVGLGVGEYTADSRRLRWHLETLHDFDWLAVRDSESARHLQSLEVRAQVDVSTDLAFATELWLSRGEFINSTSRRIVAILRSWSLQDGAQLQERVISALDRHQGEIVYLLFDELADAGLRKRLGDRSIVSYRPGDFGAVLDLMRGASAIVSSRAHGGIVGAILGRPTVLVPIEPKLQVIHEMLPESTSLLKSGSLKGFEVSLQRALQRDPTLARSEVGANRKQIETTLSELASVVRQRLGEDPQGSE